MSKHQPNKLEDEVRKLVHRMFNEIRRRGAQGDEITEGRLFVAAVPPSGSDTSEVIINFMQSAGMSVGLSGMFLHQVMKTDPRYGFKLRPIWTAANDPNGRRYWRFEGLSLVVHPANTTPHDFTSVTPSSS